MLKATAGYALVQLADMYDSGLSVAAGKYDSTDRGILVSYSGKDMEYQSGDMVYFKEYECTKPIEYNGKSYIFVPMNKIMGYKEMKNA